MPFASDALATKPRPRPSRNFTVIGKFESHGKVGSGVKTAINAATTKMSAVMTGDANHWASAIAERSSGRSRYLVIEKGKGSI